MVAAGLQEGRLAAVEGFLGAVKLEVGETSRLCRELDGLVRPEFVLNFASRGNMKTVHRATVEGAPSTDVYISQGSSSKVVPED